MFYMRIENNTYHPTKGSLADSWLSFLTRWGVLSLTEHTEFTEVLSTRINSWKVFSLTEHTDFTELFHQRFEPTERLRHTEFTERYC